MGQNKLANLGYTRFYLDKTLCPPWTVISKGREAFNKFKIEGDSVTITLASNEMVLIQ